MRISSFAAAGWAALLAGCVSAPAGDPSVASLTGHGLAAANIERLVANAPRKQELSPLFSSAALVAAPTDAIRAHQGNAASFVNGAEFFARGKILDQRVKETPIVKAEIEAPEGWRLIDDNAVHLESGLVCPLSFNINLDDAPYILSLQDIAQFDEKGRDVGCKYSTGAATLVVFASFYPDISLDEHAAAAVSTMRQYYHAGEALPVSTASVTDKETGAGSDNIGPTVAGAFDIGEVNGVPYKAALWLGVTHSWHVKVLGVYPQDDLTSEILGAVLFATNYLGVDKKNKNSPTPTGPEV